MNDCPECGTISEITPHFDYCEFAPKVRRFSLKVDLQEIDRRLGMVLGLNTKESTK